MTRRTLLTSAMAIAAGRPAMAIANAFTRNMKTRPSDLELWYDKPAATWVEALPLGNGRIGAMVFGGVQSEHIQLNEGTLWGGGPHDYSHPGAADALPEIRRLIFEGKYAEAAELGDRSFMSVPLGQLPYQTFGDLHLDFESGGDVTDYRTSLDLDAAIATTTYTSGGTKFRRDAFVSNPDQVLVIRITADHPGAVSFKASLDSPQKHAVIAEGMDLIMQGTAGDAEGIPGATTFAGIVRILHGGGALNATSDGTTLTGADSATILVSLGTSYKNFRDVSADPMRTAYQHLEAASKKRYDTLLRAHTRDHQRLFRRVHLDLGKSQSQKPTNTRIAEFAQGEDSGLAALYFQYGRYLMIAGSRPGGQPATLQGLWNDSMSPPWGSKYTVNINTEMNYWLVESCGLSECHEPLFQMLHEVQENGQKVARVHYGAEGWVLHHNTDGWRGAAPIDGASWGIWPTGGAWLCTHIWQHYLFTGDKRALARDYPLIKGAVQFFLQTLVEHPTRGWLVTCPSTSPENSHHAGVGLCAGPTMDMQILRDLFHAFLEGGEILKQDTEMQDQVQQAQKKLAPMQIGHLGQLQEWLEDWDADAPEIHHRHVSHMYGLFPSNQIVPNQTPDLFAAAKKSLELRGDAGTGWSLAWKINLWARLLDGDHAYGLILKALRPEGTEGEGGGVYPNLFDAHPPFQIDGNFGFTSGMAEMLVQSQNQEIHLLPALPSAWPTGAASGLRARGGHIIDLAWKNAALTSATIHIGWQGDITVRYRNREVPIKGAVGDSITLAPDQFQ